MKKYSDYYSGDSCFSFLWKKRGKIGIYKPKAPDDKNGDSGNKIVSDWRTNEAGSGVNPNEFFYQSAWPPPPSPPLAVVEEIRGY